MAPPANRRRKGIKMSKIEARLWIVLVFTLIAAGIGAMGALVDLASAEAVYEITPNPELQSSWLALDRYPRWLVGTADGRSLGLMPAKLTAPLFALRYRTGDIQWVEVALPAGTMVAVDSHGRPWYLLPVGTRIYVPPAGN